MRRTLKRLAWILPIALLVLGVTGSSKIIKKFGRDHMRVDGVELEYQREIDLEIDIDHRLEIESALGDILLEGVEDRTARLRVEIFEYTPGDLSVELDEDGRLVFVSEDGHPGAIGEVVGEIPADIDLDLTTGLGDVELEDLSGGHSIIVETGMGGVMLAELAGYRRLEVESGKGDIRLGPAEDLDFVELATGLGGIKVQDTQVEDLEVSTGMGGIRFLDCAFGQVSGGTGMGSVKFKRTTFEDSDVSTGLGGVSYH